MHMCINTNGLERLDKPVEIQLDKDASVALCYRLNGGPENRSSYYRYGAISTYD